MLRNLNIFMLFLVFMYVQAYSLNSNDWDKVDHDKGELGSLENEPADSDFSARNNMPKMPSMEMFDMQMPDMSMPDGSMHDMKMPDMKMPDMPTMKPISSDEIKNLKPDGPNSSVHGSYSSMSSSYKEVDGKPVENTFTKDSVQNVNGTVTEAHVKN